MSEVISIIRERLLTKIYEEINTNRSEKGLSSLSQEEKKLICDEVNSVIAERYYATTFVYDEEYYDTMLARNLQEEKNQNIIKRFSNCLNGISTESK